MDTKLELTDTDIESPLYGEIAEIIEKAKRQ